MTTEIDVPVAGLVEPGFAKVKDAFVQNFADYGEIGGRVDLDAKQVAARFHRVLARLLGGDVVHAVGDRVRQQPG